MKNISNNLIIATGFLIPLGVATQNISLLLLLIATLLTVKKRKAIKMSDPKAFILLIFCPLLLILSSLHDITFLVENPNVFLAVVIPLLLSVRHELARKEINKILLAFVISVSLLSLSKTLVFIYQEGIESILVFPQKKLASLLIRYSYLNLSMYVGSAIIFSLYLMKTGIMKKSILIVNSFLLLVFLVLLSSRLILLATLLTVFLLIMFNTAAKKRFLVTVSFGVFVLTVSTTMYFLDLPIVEKMKEAINYNNEYSNIKEKWGGRIMRQEIWYCAAALITEKPIFGHGYNNVQNKLNGCYENTSENPVLYRGKSKKNAHNQFLQFTLATGVLGLFAFLTVIFYAIKKSVSTKDLILFSFITFAALCFLTESHLERNHTIYLFYFFVSLLLQQVPYEKSNSQ